MCAIYLKHGSELAEMVEKPYEAEEVLQRLLADYPDLLGGDDDREDRKRWLFVRREFGVAAEEDAGDRWSVDHLFLDEEGVPTLVEVKRRSDTRIRREVVGQMLDYAANASVFWSVEKIRASFEATCESQMGFPLRRWVPFSVRTRMSISSGSESAPISTREDCG